MGPPNVGKRFPELPYQHPQTQACKGRSGSAFARCTECAIRQVCIPQGLEAAVLPRFEALVMTGRRVRAGEPLYFLGDRFQSLYAVRSGSLKTFITHREGREQITGLRLPGEALGLDGIASGVQTLSAVALEDSTVCTLPYSALKDLGRESTAMQDRLHQVMGEEINRESTQMMMLGSLSAESRLASFLLDVSERNGLRGYSPSEFRLRLTREEMGSYLGITLETVSRSMTRLRKLGLIVANAKDIRITDFDGLREIAAVASPAQRTAGPRVQQTQLDTRRRAGPAVQLGHHLPADNDPGTVLLALM